MSREVVIPTDAWALVASGVCMITIKVQGRRGALLINDAPDDNTAMRVPSGTGRYQDFTRNGGGPTYVRAIGKNWALIVDTGPFISWNGPPQVPSDFFNEVTLGNVPGQEVVTKFGYNPSVNGVEEDLWTRGGIYVFPPDGGEEMEIVSDNAADTSPAFIELLDETGAMVTPVVALEGTTPVALGVHSRHNRAFNVGGTEWLGTVHIRSVSSPLVIYGEALANDQGTQQMIYTVPLGRALLIQDVISSVNKVTGGSLSGIVRIRLRIRGGVWRALSRFGLQRDGSSLTVSASKVTAAIPALSDIRFTAETTGADVEVAAFYSALLIDENLVN